MCNVVSVLKELSAFIFWDMKMCNVVSVLKELSSFIYWDVTMYHGCGNVHSG